MVRSIKALRETPDEVLIAEHDEHAQHTFVGTEYYQDELHRRAQERAARASDRLARASFVLAAVSAVSSIAAVWIAVLALG